MGTFDKVKEILSKQVSSKKFNPDLISENTELDSLGLDSLDIAEVLINIEQSFSLPEVSTEERVDIKKVSDIVSLIDKYQK